MASAGQIIGILAACGGSAVALLVPNARIRYGAIVIALVASLTLITGQVWNTSRLASLRHHPAEAAGLAVVALGFVGALAAVFRRYHWAFPLFAFAVIGLRVSIDVGGQSSSLLVPLYVVTAAGAIALGIGAWNEEGTPPPVGEQTGHWRALAIEWLPRILAAYLVLYAIQSTYSEDPTNAVENAAFFLVPFAVLFVLLSELDWTDWLLARVLGVTAAVALVFSLIAIAEYAGRHLILNPDLVQENAIHLYYRVNSLFRDPNVFGRYVALTMVALGAYLAWERRPLWAWGTALLSGVLLVALAFSFSVTSFAALIAGLLVVVWKRFSLRWAAGSLAAMAVAGVAFLAVSGIGSADLSNPNEASSGRVPLVSGGLRLARAHPLWGWGSGSFGAAFSRHIKRAKTTASHSEPITVAAEQGAIGLVVYLALIGASLLILLGGPMRASPARVAVGACYVALIVHSLGYADFATDPASWALLALGLALARGQLAGAEAPARVRAPA
jgi:putative inorganic carbon (HCO3(-)) transporter